MEGNVLSGLQFHVESMIIRIWRRAAGRQAWCCTREFIFWSTGRSGEERERREGEGEMGESGKGGRQFFLSNYKAPALGVLTRTLSCRWPVLFHCLCV